MLITHWLGFLADRSTDKSESHSSKLKLTIMSPKIWLAQNPRRAFSFVGTNGNRTRWQSQLREYHWRPRGRLK
jgi:hypothetical protein